MLKNWNILTNKWFSSNLGLKNTCKEKWKCDILQHSSINIKCKIDLFNHFATWIPKGHLGEIYPFKVRIFNQFRDLWDKIFNWFQNQLLVKKLEALLYCYETWPILTTYYWPNVKTIAQQERNWISFQVIARKEC